MATQLIYKYKIWNIIFYFFLQHLFLNTLESLQNMFTKTKFSEEILILHISTT